MKYNWTDNKVIDFVNWFLDLHKLPFRYKLENQTIIDSFKNGDDFKLWQKNDIYDENIHNDMKTLLVTLHNKLNSVGPDFDWGEFINISIECENIQNHIKNKKMIDEM